MRSIIFLLSLVATTNILAQKSIKIIDKCDINKLVKYIDKGGDFNEQLIRYDENNKKFEIGLLTYAVHAQCLEIIQYLLDSKDQIQDFDLEVTEAFIYSLSVGNDEISNLLYEQSPIPHGICDACHSNNALMVSALYGREDWYFKLKPKSDLEYINNYGGTLIHSAASGPSQKILEDVLTIEELDINKADAEQLTCLDYAASNEKNEKAFNTLIEHGADYAFAWNLLYWWSMYPNVPLTDEMIEERRADAWILDDPDENCLMIISYYYHEFDSLEGEFARRLNILLDILIEDHKEGRSDLAFVRQFYANSVTMNMLDAMLFIEDFNSDQPLYPKYLEFVGMLCEDAEFCPVYKKEFKTACKIYGDEIVTEWYEKYGVPEE